MARAEQVTAVPHVMFALWGYFRLQCQNRSE